VETIAFLESLVRALGRGWSARYGMIAPYGVFGVTLTSDVGGSVEIVPSLVRGEVVTWSPFVFTRGTPHYDVYTDDGVMTRTPVLADAVARLERWRRARGPGGRVAARLARTGQRRLRSARTTEVEIMLPAGDTAPMAAVSPASEASEATEAKESLAGALQGKKRGKIDHARKLAKQHDRGEAARELLAIARRSSGDARINALDVLAGVARPVDGPELARYLSDAEREVQRIAIDVIKRIGYAAAVPALAAIVLGRDGKATSGKTKLAVAAATAMKVLSGRRGAAALTNYLHSADPRVREAACVAFTLFVNPGTKAARPVLEDLLADGDPRVAKAAKRALATL
jgi:hypothetical protein